MSTAPSSRQGTLSRLYTGTGAFDIVGRRKIWYVALGIVLLVSVASLLLRGVNLGIDFTGGSQIRFPAVGATGTADPERARTVFEDTLGREPASVQLVGTGPSASIVIRSESLSRVELDQIRQALFAAFQPLDTSGNPSLAVISDNAVSGTWGGQITRQALIALAVFLLLVSVFLGFYFERAMAVAAIAALLHDLVVTAGVYSIVGFEVTPATVVGLLTILGFSLYDTVVVFDRVKELTRGILNSTRRTYAETANLALNQVLMRSINTSIIAVLPVAGLMVIGVGLLGVGTLADLALVQMVGIIAGTVSSVFLATPILVDLKLRDPRYRQQAERVRLRRGKAEGTGSGDGGELADEEEAAAELRRARAMSALAGVPARVGKQRPRGTEGNRAARRRRPAGKPRSQGKRRR